MVSVGLKSGNAQRMLLLVSRCVLIGGDGINFKRILNNAAIIVCRSQAGAVSSARRQGTGATKRSGRGA